MKILHLSSGVQTSSQVYKLHLELTKRGFQSQILTVRGMGDLLNVQEIDFLDKILYSIGRVLSTKIAKYLYNGGAIDLSLINLNKYIDRIFPDIVHVHVGYGGFLSEKKLRKLKCKLVCTSHDLWHFNVAHPICDDYIFESKRSKKGNNKNKRYVSLFEKIIFPSEYSKKISNCGDEEKFVVIPNFVTTSIHNGSEKKEIIERIHEYQITVGLSATRQSFEKGFDRVEDLILSQKFKFNFVSCGGGEVKGVRNLWPLIDHANMKLFFDSIDCLLISSRFESFSQLCVESLICGVPVILMNKIGCVEYLEDWMYFILEESTCQADVEIFINQFRIKNMGFSMNAYFSDLSDRSITECCDLYRDLYEEIN